MPLRLTFRPGAEADLQAIFDYIAAHNPAAAHKFRAVIAASCESLVRFPNRGTVRTDLGPGIRTFGVKRRATVAFRILPDRVQIVGIFYCGRDIEAAFEDEDRLDFDDAR